MSNFLRFSESLEKNTSNGVIKNHNYLRYKSICQFGNTMDSPWSEAEKILDCNTSFETSLSKLSEIYIIFNIGSTILKLWLLKDVQLQPPPTHTHTHTHTHTRTAEHSAEQYATHQDSDSQALEGALTGTEWQETNRRGARYSDSLQGGDGDTHSKCWGGHWHQNSQHHLSNHFQGI